MTDKLDFNKALEKIQLGKSFLGEDGILTSLTKQLTRDTLLQVEIK